MNHPGLIRLKNYGDDTSKFAYKAHHAVERMLDDDMLRSPTVIMVYSTGCGHCVDFMKDTIVGGVRQKSLWRRFRHTLLRKGFTVLQINVNALPHFQSEAAKVSDKRLSEVVRVTQGIYGVPSLVGMDARGAAKEYEGARSMEGLVEFMRGMLR